ncbi:hypothetical protein G9A89_010846 [Geosiphon pyriformis]|nr:hypothetical protein G9A89_010846 [Geosiphon pyriformis]
MYNVWGINVSAKQKDVVHWHKDMSNLISIITEIKLKDKDMTMQSPVFAVGLVIEDVLEKNHKLWLVLQDMQKAYDSVK